MKYLLIPFLLFLVACEQSNTPSELKTDIINIEMGGVYHDFSYGEEYQTEVGDAYIHTGWDGDQPTWEIMQGCQYKYPNRTDFGAYVFRLGMDDNYYYFNSIDFKILRNPQNNQVDNGLIYNLTSGDQGDELWEIRKGSKVYYYDPTEKTFFTINFSNLNPNGWAYTW